MPAPTAPPLVTHLESRMQALGSGASDTQARQLMRERQEALEA